MTMKSMTGFARAEGSLGSARWHWEVRSVNGRGLDLRFRLPPGLDLLETRCRETAQRRLARGSITANLNLQSDARGAEIRLNEAALAQVMKAAARVRELTGGEPASIDALLGIKGVLEIAEVEHGISDELTTAILATFDTALAGLVSARAAEGRRLATILADQLVSIETQVAIAARSPARTVEAISRRLVEAITRLTEASSMLDPARLHQEAVMLATRADIEEEVKRLTAHVAAARDLLGAEDAVGRKFDFLAQEFNREANTLCSKANDGEITRAGLALKTVIDQLREQVQNIE